MFHKRIDFETLGIGILISSLVILLIAVIGFLIWGIANTYYIDTPVKGVVTRHNYEPPQVHFYSSSSKNGTTVHSWTTPAKYKIVVKYKNFTEEFENKSLYNCLQDGDSIKVIFVKSYRKKTNELINEYIRLPY